MENTAEKPKRLYYLEYTDMVFYYLPDPFQLVGFECKGNYWKPEMPERLVEHVLPDLENWQPDIIFWRLRPVVNSDLIKEPEEWLAFCQHLRDHPSLQHAKIMALFSGTLRPPSALEAEWSQRYDYYDLGPLRAIRHARMAKQLVGQPVKGVEVVNSNYLPRNGTWKIHKLQNEVEGEFDKPPLTRLLTLDIQDSPVWIRNGIQAGRPTYIVYIVKDRSAWQGALDPAEIERLARLANLCRPGDQLLVGMNETVLQIKPNVLKRVLEQVQGAGGWQIFLIEHMWFECFWTLRPSEIFERIVYHGAETVTERRNLMIM